MKIGAHVSIAKGIENAPANAQKIGAGCFQFFTRSPHGGNYKKIDPSAAGKFLKACSDFGFETSKDYIVHTPYFINLASENNRIFYGSVNTIRQELETASLLKTPFVITHIGSSKDLDGEDLQKKINEKVMKGIIKIYENYSGAAMLVLEIAAGSGNIIGDTFEEIGYFIKTALKEKIKLGFCFDTCHSFSAGYDLRTPEKVRKVFDEIDKKIGLKNLKCIHFNDSQAEFNSHIDRHEHIGAGKIGASGLREVAKIAKELDLNIYLETKHDKVVKDIELTKSFVA